MAFSLLGIDTQTGEQVEILQSSRREGLYIIGTSGTGKSTFLENLILQDIEQGLGVCLLDPYSDVIPSILCQLPEHRLNDVILLDIEDNEYTFGLNPLISADHTDNASEQYMVNQVMKILEKFYDLPMPYIVSDYLRNCIYTLMANPGSTLIDIALLLMQEEFRIHLVANVTNPRVRSFWQEYNQMEPRRRQDVASAVLNRLADLDQRFARQIIGQSKTTVNMRQVMDEQKILLVKLSARFGAVTSLIGSMIVAQILDVASSRADTPVTKRTQFNVYLEEFQRFTTEGFAEFLMFGRKFGIATTIAHQTRNQLDPLLKMATLTMANIAVFRAVAQDAEELVTVFDAPSTSAASSGSIQERQNIIVQALTHLPNFTAKVRINDADGRPIEHTIKTLERRKKIDLKTLQRRLLYIREKNIAQGYIRPRETVEEEINQRYQQRKINVFDAALDSPASIRIRITEDPLTARNLTTILAAFTGLHAKNWLIQQGRFVDLFDYTQTYDIRFDEEANLVIAQLTHNSPTIIELLITSTGAVTLAIALKMALDAVIGVWDRRRSLVLKNQAVEAEIERKKQEAQIVFEDKKQHTQIDAGEAYIKFQHELITLEKKRLELQKEKLEFEVKRLDHASRAAVKIVDVLHPQADAVAKAIAARSLVNNILELCDGKELELLPVPQDTSNTIQIKLEAREDKEIL